MIKLGNMDPETFLREYWQKKPCLFRGAYSEQNGFITKEELAGLAMEPTIEARIVVEKAGDYPWQVMHGPFKASSFRELPATNWSLLVQGVERVLPEAAAILNDFSFIPNWRLDDIMISYAPDQGSVGPHTDSYDVFLIQGTGMRRWLIGAETWTGAEFVPGLDLRILKNFKPTLEWTVEAGDMIYLPPNVPHHGIAIGSAITYSVGFRAPHHREILTNFANHVAQKIQGDWYYADPDLRMPLHPGEIADSAFSRLEQIVATYLKDGEALREWFGTYVTEPKNDSVVRHPDEPYSEEQVLRRLAQGETLLRTEGGRIAYVPNLGDGIGIYADGNGYRLNGNAQDFAICLSEQLELKYGELQRFLAHDGARSCLIGLVNDGFLYFSADWEEE